MSTADEKKDASGSMISEYPEVEKGIGSEEKEEAENLSDLAEKKDAEKKFWAESNMAQTQIFINSMDGNLNLGYKKKREERDLKQTIRKYDLRDQEQCTEFVETFRDGEYLALALILCTFEAVVVGDLPELKSKILKYLPATESMDNEGIHYPKQDPYLSINTILAVIGGHCFTTAEGQNCIGLGEHSEKGLRNLMEQFPMLRDSIVCWLIQLIDSYRYRTTFDAYQIATAFARVISLDFSDAKKRIFPQMYLNSGNAELLGTLIYMLYQEDRFRIEAENILLQWLKSTEKWLWKPACMTCLFLWENEHGFIYKENLKKAIRRNIWYFQWKDWVFIRELLFQSKSFRTMFAELFKDVYTASDDKSKQMIWAEKYVNLIRRCYYKVNFARFELPLVACDTKEQQKCLSQVIRKVMSNYNLRRQLYLILEAYLKELSSYAYSETTVCHIAAYFFNMASVGLEFRQDIFAFLKRCQNKVAEQIFKQLQLLYANDRRKELSTYE